jgi:hypothetical protein
MENKPLEPQVRKRLEGVVQQADKFGSLALHPQWEYYRKWAELARDQYFKRAHDPNSRESHVELARALEGYDAINNLLEGFDGVIQRGTEARIKLDRA